MGQVKKSIADQDDLRDLLARIQNLVEGGQVQDGVIEGIARQVAHRGEESLTSNQQYHWDTVRDLLYPACWLCGSTLEPEMLFDWGGSEQALCNYHDRP